MMDCKYRIMFIILHYKTIDDTKKCIESITLLDGSEHDAVVLVDNSVKLSDTGKQLKKKYSSLSNFFYVENNENSSFSHGNNLGYQLAKSLGGGQFVVVTNSDTYFVQKNFYQKLVRVWKKEMFHVCGPNIIDPFYKIGTSPIAYNCLTVEGAEKDIQYYRNKCERILDGTYIEHPIKQYRFMKILRPVKSVFQELIKKIRISSINSYPVLNGACLIFSYLFLQKNDKIFYPETELYGEEQLLAYNCRKKMYKVAYCPNLKVMHVGGASTKVDTVDTKERILKSYRRIIKSREIYLNYIRNN